jgi:AraC family transcriptional regulator
MPKNPTRQSYLERLDRVDDYIHVHLEGDLSIDRLAEVACLSPYHWSRVYAAMRGETVAARIRRLRLQRAADGLASTDIALDRIASLAGYRSTDTFGRAFREAFGDAPARFRATGAHAAFKRALGIGDALGFPVSIVTLPDQRCAGIDHVGSYMRIGHAMGRLFSELSKRGSLPDVPSMIGVFFDDPDLAEEAALRSRACMPVGNHVSIDDPLVETTLNGGLCARLRYTGPYAAMGDAYRWMLGTWLPASGYEPRDAPIFEVYLDDPSQVSQSELRTDIHLPLKVPE